MLKTVYLLEVLKRPGNKLYCVLLLLSSVIFLGTSFIIGFDQLWKLWNIPVRPYFADLLVITGAGDSLREGFDPLYLNPGDPWHRELNYPRIWQHIVSNLGIGKQDTLALGIVFITLFLFSTCICFPPYDKSTAVLLYFAICSPAAMLAIERANSDILLFFVLAIMLIVSRLSGLLTALLLLIASFLKFFPIFAATILLRYSPRLSTTLFLVVALCFSTYLLWHGTDLTQIFTSTLKGFTVFSYGGRSHSLTLEFLPSLIPCFSILTMTYVYFLINASNVKRETSEYRFIDSFRVGASIYVGTFLLGNNWSYRLIFLLFVIPQLLDWFSRTNYKPLPLLTLVTVFFSLWSIILDPIPISGAIDEIANWLLLSCLFYFLLESSPTWIKHYLTFKRHSDSNTS